MDKELTRVIKKYNISPEDVFTHDTKGYRVIKRKGIKAVKNRLGIRVELKLVHAGEKSAVILASTNFQDTHIETFGEAAPLNNTFPYPVAVAQKRAESRLVIEASGLIQHDWIGEDEVDEYVKDEALIKKAKSKADASIEATMKKMGL